jgi:predicted secreted protein
MGLKLGLNCKAYYGAAGVTATNLLANIRDVTLNLEKGEADVTTRSAGGWRATVGTLKEGSVEFEMVWDDTDAGFVAIKDAYFNDSSIALCFLDGVGGSGLDADFSVINFSRKEMLEDAVKVDVTVKPTYSTRAPAWV